ncbi:ATP phosphoribosyltransferase regulatory subunit [Oceanobacter sp. 4_MG-2023]|uniref:ATP phosphoribosyltransferase regulatory subunit n=1 Tax=Oceanobacter sp. 4_MG-2023 TaxID=3062623 RepID=UPI0027349349|nr:ATP phosphoribosyltransferase regulatory subunit [Oceanobacter sp. 4_MG-2023]MDP2547539.1 ATP phosphoribosyltransferase regulatory subunit [Oceanobacter sp. 4_MG-2023]
MTLADRWLLPDGIEEVLPPGAQQIEHLRRRLLDLMDSWGYDLVTPPVLEYLDALLTGTGKDLDLRTFKVTDQISGRMMGLSADTTPQVARIDAHSLARDGISRFCYCRTIFHTRARSLLANRTPTQIGAELFGEAGVAADVEVLSMMLSLLTASGVKNIHLDIGNVGVYRAIAEQAEVTDAQQTELFDLLKLKCASDIDAWAEREIADNNSRKALQLLARLQGTLSGLANGFDKLIALVPGVASELEHLQAVANQVLERFPGVPLYIDLTELRGYQYHTGLVFGAYIPGYGDAIAQGGRYDETGKAFGRARPARGFSADLRVLARLGDFAPERKPLVLAPATGDAALWQYVNELRQQGMRVISCREQDTPQADYSLQIINGQWQLVQVQPA